MKTVKSYENNQNINGWPDKSQKVSKHRYYPTSGMAVKPRPATDITFLRGFITSQLGEP